MSWFRTLALVALAGCATPVAVQPADPGADPGLDTAAGLPGAVDDPAPGDDHGAVVRVDDAAAWRAAMAVDGVVIDPGVPFAQVGYLLDGRGVFDLTYRLDDDPTWHPLPITWAEGEAAVGRVFVDADDPDAVATRLVVRGPEGVTFGAFHVYETRVADPDLLTRDLPLDTPPLTRSAGLPSWVVTRAAWGARNPGKTCGSAHTPRRATIHHTVTPNQDSMTPPARMRQIQAFHIDSNGWCDVGYHFMVGIDGKVYQGRNNELRTGAHVSVANRDNIGVNLVGNFVSFEPREVQLAGAARIVRWLHDRYGVPLTRTAIRGHGEYMATACPGTRLQARLGEIITRATGATPAPAVQVASLVGFVREGDIQDAERPVVGATVRVPGASTTTDVRGFYRFDDLALGTYRVEVQASGFAAASVDRVVDQPGQDHYASVALSSAGTLPWVLPGVDLSVADAVRADWERLGDGSWKLWADAPADAVRVDYFVDTWPIGSGVDASSDFEIRYRFGATGLARRLDAVAYDAAGLPVGWSHGALDVSADAGVTVRRVDRRTYEIGLERVPWAVRGLEVQVDGWTLTDLSTGTTRSTSRAITYRFGTIGARALVLHTYNGDGSYRGSLRRTVELED